VWGEKKEHGKGETPGECPRVGKLDTLFKERKQLVTLWTRGSHSREIGGNCQSNKAQNCK